MALIGACFLLGCGHRPTAQDTAAWRSFVEAAADPLRIARLDVPGSVLASSFDPTGENDDYNHYVRKGPKGWWVIADLKGPGYISRFWTTGADENHGLRLYFDDESRPSVSTTIGDFLGPRDNRCFHCYAPVTYSNRLVVMIAEGGTKDPAGGWPRIFYQINYSRLPPDRSVPSFPRVFDEAARKEIEAAKDAWRKPFHGKSALNTVESGSAVVIAAGSSARCAELKGPGIIRELRLTPDLAGIESAVMREQILRRATLRISWDNAPAPSVDVPLGPFFGSMIRRARYDSMFLGMEGATFICRFPMPFRDSATVELRNPAGPALPLNAQTFVQPLAGWDESLGYFHACRQRSGESDVGRPHVMLRARGRGKYVGCILAVGSRDRSWWMLEGDETIRVDGEPVPGWRGTGLEDYFNSGWYYANPRAFPLSGLLFRAPFRTVQYRFHLNDAVNFSDSVEMLFERGPRQASKGWMESVAYFYMAKPSSCESSVDGGQAPARDDLEQLTIMSELIDQERFGDFQGARDHIGEFLATYTNYPGAALLRLRQISYQEAIEGYQAAQDKFRQFIEGCGDKEAARQAKGLTWYHENESNALMGLYCNARTKLFVDGKQVVEVDHPERMFFFPVVVSPGRHVIALESKWMRTGGWAQFWLRTHDGDVFSGAGWRYSYDEPAKEPQAGWTNLSFDDSSWDLLTNTGDWGGPPEVPYVKLEPNAFAGTQSRAVGIYVADNKIARFRKVFETRPTGKQR